MWSLGESFCSLNAEYLHCHHHYYAVATWNAIFQCIPIDSISWKKCISKISGTISWLECSRKKSYASENHNFRNRSSKLILSETPYEIILSEENWYTLKEIP